MVAVPFRKGDEIDGFSLARRLGRGGNGEVWLASSEQHGEVALKLLRRTDGDRWQRFSDEISVMKSLEHHPGVLPLVAAELPRSPSDGQPWLATAVATPVAEALGQDASLVAVVEVARDYALTLADLAGRGIGHRDIKPDNLFRYEERWVLGDFGLATYPMKSTITTSARRLGPLYFMAPEMLRSPDEAEAEPADVYSLAKTLWVLASGQRYPPEGQVRTDIPQNDLSQWASERGALALGLLIERATAVSPADRPASGEFAAQLDAWLAGGARRDDDAAAEIREAHLRELGRDLSSTLEPGAFADIETRFREVVTDARRESEERQREARREAMREAENSRIEYVQTYGVVGVLRLHDSAWIGSLGAGDDLVLAVTTKPTADREAELIRARQFLWGRPLWWSHTVGLVGFLKLRGVEGCEPLASELALQEIRYHLLEFFDHPVLAASWQLQRALIPLTARIVALGPMRKLSEAVRSAMSAADRLRFSLDPSWFFMQHVTGQVQKYLHALTPWTIERFDAEREQVESAFVRIPIPPGPWLGPIHDPWLQSWGHFSPIQGCGLAALQSSPESDDLLGASELRTAIGGLVDCDEPWVRDAAASLRDRLAG